MERPAAGPHDDQHAGEAERRASPAAGSVNFSLRKIQARSAVHTGIVNSIANTVASVSAPIEYTHST